MQHSLYFLMKLRHARFPVRIDEPEEIKFVTVLKATGLIEANIEPPLVPTRTYVAAQIASVICITEEGMAELDHWLSGPRQRTA